MEEKTLKEWKEIFVIKTNPDKTASIKGIKKYQEVIDIPKKSANTQ